MNAKNLLVAAFASATLLGLAACGVLLFREMDKCLLSCKKNATFAAAKTIAN